MFKYQCRKCGRDSYYNGRCYADFIAKGRPIKDMPCCDWGAPRHKRKDNSKTKERAFKHGAYWAICQGEYVDGEVVSTSTNGWECIRIFKKLHTSGDKVRVKIIHL